MGRERKRFATIQVLDAYKHQIGRLPQVEQCLLEDLDTVIRLQEDSSAMCFDVLL